MPERDLEHPIRFELANVIRFGSRRRVSVRLCAAARRSAAGTAASVGDVAPRQVVRGYLDPLYAEGIYPEILDIGAFSLPRGLPAKAASATCTRARAGRRYSFLKRRNFGSRAQVSVDLSPLVELGRQRARGGGTGSAAVDGVAPDDPLVVKAFEELAVAVERTLDYHRARRRAAVVTELIEGLIVSGELGQEPKICRGSSAGHRYSDDVG